MSHVTLQGTLSFPKLFKAEQIMGQGDPKYQAVLILTPESLEVYKKEMLSCMSENFKSGQEKKPSFRWPLRKCDDSAHYQGDPRFAGRMFVNLKSDEKNKPKILNQQREEIIDPSVIYSGCEVATVANVYHYDNKFGAGMGTGFNVLMKVSDGERLGGGSAPDIDAMLGDIVTTPDSGGSATAAPAGDMPQMPDFLS